MVALPYALERKALFFGAFTGAGLLRRDPPDRYVFNYRASYAEETYAVVRYLVKVRGLRPDQIAVFAQQDAYGDAGFEGVAKAMRGMAGAMKDLEDRQKSRATRVKRDTLDQALLELALFYRDILMLQLGAGVELANPESDLRKLASASTPEATLRRIQAIMRCRERLTLNVAPLLAVEEMTLSLTHP